MRPAADGAPEGAHDDSAARQWAALGRAPKAKPESAEQPGFPGVIAYLWVWFQEIIGGVPPNGMAAPRIGWRDLTAWCEMTGEVLDPWEARLLIDLSSLRLGVLSEKKPSP